MNLEQAEIITKRFSDAFTNKPPNNFCARSQLGGYSFIEISRAVALVIAGRRQIAGEDSRMKEECTKFADGTGYLIGTLELMVVTDEQFERLARFPDDSPDRQRVLLEIAHSLETENATEGEQLRKEETPNSFNSYCWGLDHSDPLYWQKIYTRLGLAYDENSPIGLPNSEQSDGKKSFFFPNLFFKYTFVTPRKKQEKRRSVIIGLITIIVFISWLIWWFCF